MTGCGIGPPNDHPAGRPHPTQWRIVQDILRRHVPDHPVRVFGSRAKDTATRYSDLDLAIVTRRPLLLQVRGSLAEDFTESDLPSRVDILDWATTQRNVRRIVEQDKVIIQPGQPGDPQTSHHAPPPDAP